MSVAAERVEGALEPREGIRDAPPRPLDIVFAMRSIASLRSFQPWLELLVERGHRVRLVLEGRDSGPAEQAWLDKTLQRPNFAADDADELRGDPWHKRAVALRVGIEYVNALGPAFGGRDRYRKKALSRRPPVTVRWLAGAPLLRTQRGLSVLHSLLGVIERALPPPRRLGEYLERLSPDLLVLGDFASRGSLHPTFVRAAKRLGIPVATCIASWDNLSTRPPMRALPHRLLVWNEAQRREAVELHGVPAERVVVTGAPTFDHWFGWTPRPREEFLARVGLDPAKPVVLWVGGALNSWEQPETRFVSRWLAALRSCGRPIVEGAGVLLRPHPYRVREWVDADFSRFGDVAVWPREATMPIEAEQRADYYDSIYHSAVVVGIITSAMIEAAIVGRPVLTVLDPAHHDSQLGALHHSYLRESGAVRVAETLEAHTAQLAALLEGGDGGAHEAAARFVGDFVRPRGLDRPAAPFVVEALERIAELEVDPEREPLWIAPLRALTAASAAVTTPARLKRLRRGRKRIQRLVNRGRKLLAAPRLAVRARLEPRQSRSGR